MEFDKTYFRVEPTLDCRQKESVQVKQSTQSGAYFCAVDRRSNVILIVLQGSHVMTHVGNYVLQWTCPPSETTTAQLMFFYEVLSSAHYKGSMSNLQSGISAMSLASSCQSR